MDNRLFFMLNMAQRKLYNHVDKVCADELDASVTQLAALMFIAKNEGCLQKDVAKALALNKSAVTGLLGRIEKNGLLQRIACDEDARAIKLYATKLGIQKTIDVMPHIDGLNYILSDEFSDEEIATVIRFLNFVLKRF